MARIVQNDFNTVIKAMKKECSLVPEIMKVLAMGYQLIRIHEVWHFPESQTGLFEGYVNTWLKLKQESS